MELLKLTQELIRRPSITPNDKGCQETLSKILLSSFFQIEHIQINQVNNLWATHGTSNPVFCFLGHTDVVPTGPLEDWTHPPFAGIIENNILYGRGAADMKGSLAAFIIAAQKFIKESPNHKGTLAILLTSDEEGLAQDGIRAIVPKFQEQNRFIDYCLVGEPSCENILGDTIKNGRRGSLTGKLKVKGLQGHIAYPQLAKNPIHISFPILSELIHKEWDKGNEFFPATSFQISNINAGTGADNVIPGTLEIVFNFRFSTEQNSQKLISYTENLLNKSKIDYALNWHLSGEPFLTEPGHFSAILLNAIKKETNIEAVFSTAGGTSDGRFLAPTGTEILEFGPINKSIHKINEHILIEDLEKTSKIYYEVIKNILA